MVKVGDLLSEAESAEINRLAREAATHLEQGEAAPALVKIEAALRLFPEPVEGWQLSFELLSAGFEATMALGQHDAAREFVRRAADCAEADEIQVYLMRGQVSYEQGDQRGAAAQFLHVLLGAGPAAFSPEDPKYYRFACEHLRPPEGCSSWDEFSPVQKKPWWRFWSN